MSDKVNHPSYYKAGGNYECIDVMEDQFGKDAANNFCLLNAFKYLYRCNFKENCIEDLKKADWYIQHLIQNLENTDEVKFGVKKIYDK